MSQAVDPARLVAALTDAGWVEVGRRTGEYIRMRWRDERSSLMIPLDATAPEFGELMTGCLKTLERMVEAGNAAARALTLATCSCEGRRWVDDAGWSPEDYEITAGTVRREPGRGLIPCGFCNEGGWDVDPVEVKP